jgi:hypothetical protein
MVCNTRQHVQRPNRVAAYDDEKSLKAVISKPIIHRSCPWEASIRFLGLENKSILLALPQDNEA